MLDVSVVLQLEQQPHDRLREQLFGDHRFSRLLFSVHDLHLVGGVGRLHEVCSEVSFFCLRVVEHLLFRLFVLLVRDVPLHVFFDVGELGLLPAAPEGFSDVEDEVSLFFGDLFVEAEGVRAEDVVHGFRFEVGKGNLEPLERFELLCQAVELLFVDASDCLELVSILVFLLFLQSIVFDDLFSVELDLVDGIIEGMVGEVGLHFERNREEGAEPGNVEVVHFWVHHDIGDIDATCFIEYFGTGLILVRIVRRWQCSIEEFIAHSCSIGEIMADHVVLIRSYLPGFSQALRRT